MSAHASPSGPAGKDPTGRIRARRQRRGGPGTLSHDAARLDEGASTASRTWRYPPMHICETSSNFPGDRVAAKFVVHIRRGRMIRILVMSLAALAASAACSAAHDTKPSTSVVPVSQLQVPAPSDVRASVVGSVATVSWTPSSQTMPSPLTGYRLNLDQDAPINLSPAIVSRRLAGRVEGSAHFVQLVAMTSTGQSSPAGSNFTMPYKTPDPSVSSQPPVAPSANAGQPTGAAADYATTACRDYAQAAGADDYGTGLLAANRAVVAANTLQPPRIRLTPRWLLT